MRKSTNQTKKRIVSAAWELFYQYGYENTTIDDIVARSKSSKGAFYHYFDSKDSLLSSLSYLFDDKYAELMENADPSLNPVEQLIMLNKELFLMIENTVSVPLLAQLFSNQVITKGERHLYSPDRMYYKVLRQIAIEGKNQGLFREDLSVNDVVQAYSMYERGMMYDWCISNGRYSLCQYSEKMLPIYLRGMLKDPALIP